MPRRRRSRIRHAAHRIRHRFHGGFHRPKLSMTSKILHAGYTALALSPRIEDTVALAQNQIDFATYQNRLIADYTGYSMNDNNFNATRLLRGYGPVAGAFVLAKVVGMIRKRWRF